MIGENWQLVTDEPVEVQDCRKVTDCFGRIYIINPNLMKENKRMSTRISTDYAQKSPRSLLTTCNADILTETAVVEVHPRTTTGVAFPTNIH